MTTSTTGMADHLGSRLALPFAVFLGIAEVVRNWGDWGFWPFWVVDYIAVGLLAWAWQAARRNRPHAPSLLAGAWGFTCAMFYMSFFGHLAELQQPDHGPIDQRPLTVIIGLLFGVTVLGFASALNAPHIGRTGSAMTRDGAAVFAADWAEAWNGGAIDRVLAHFDDNVIFRSPTALAVVGVGTVRGKEALRAYWSAAAARLKSLRFTVDRVLWDPATQELAIVYVSEIDGNAKRVSENLRFGPGGLVVAAEVFHGIAGDPAA